MAVLDIRECEGSPITEIIYSDSEYIERDQQYVVFCDRMDGTGLYIKLEAIPDLIKALQKAVELGWTE